MYGQTKTIETLEEDAHALKIKGWSFVTFFTARCEIDCSRAHQTAIQKASILEQQAGIRTVINNEKTYYEVWGRK